MHTNLTLLPLLDFSLSANDTLWPLRHVLYLGMLCCHSNEESIPAWWTGARKVADYEAAPMQIGFLYYPECHHILMRANTPRMFFCLCVIFHFVSRERVSDL